GEKGVGLGGWGLEPVGGFEPRPPALRKRCSTVERHRRGKDLRQFRFSLDPRLTPVRIRNEVGRASLPPGPHTDTCCGGFSMSDHSTPTPPPAKPERPDSSPLFWHQARRYCKKI